MSRPLSSSLVSAAVLLCAACARNERPTPSVASAAPTTSAIASAPPREKAIAPAAPTASSLTNAPLRGKLVEIPSPTPGHRYRLDYYDVSEPDSSYKELSARGLQGGGPTWAGIVTGLLELRSPD